ncbi:unnamed protein product [Adineta ricciae]|nr:unnamed protein product [Adineta ricciae]
MESSSTSAQPKLPPDTKPLQHQVAGHIYGKSKTKFGLLQRCSTGEILKPLIDERGSREEQFYKDVFSEQASKNLRILRPFISTYLGTYEHDEIKYIVLENVIHPFIHPCVADIKIGRITYDSTASAEKVKLSREKCPTLAEIGFQLLGWEMYRSSNDSYECHDRVCGRSLTKEEILHAIAHFYGAPSMNYRENIKLILEHLTDMEQVMVKQNDLTFIATSLLIVYEGQPNEKSPNKVDVRLVDFAHVSKSKEGTETGQTDENFLFGLRNYIKHLQRLLDDEYVYVLIDKLK